MFFLPFLLDPPLDELEFPDREEEAPSAEAPSAEASLAANVSKESLAKAIEMNLVEEEAEGAVGSHEGLLEMV